MMLKKEVTYTQAIRQLWKGKCMQEGERQLETAAAAMNGSTLLGSIEQLISRSLDSSLCLSRSRSLHTGTTDACVLRPRSLFLLQVTLKPLK